MARHLHSVGQEKGFGQVLLVENWVGVRRALSPLITTILYYGITRWLLKLTGQLYEFE